MTKPKLFLIDAYALIFRGYYAFIKNPRINSKGFDTSAIMGFLNSIFDIINREKPDYFSVVFDKGGSKDRREIFTEYKANRNATPEPILDSVPIIYEILKNLGISTIDKEGYEADDIIGTIALSAEKDGYETYMVTPDKDFAQLVSKNIFLYKPARFGNGVEIWGVDEVNDKFEIDHPSKVIDYLGMMGDSVDNIPGLPGVGEKTAKKFLKEYGSLEGLIENVDELKGKIKDMIIENKDLGFLSKKLATIITNVPVEYNFDDLKISEPNNDKILSIFDELEFKRLKETYKKLFNQNSNDADNHDLFSKSSKEKVKKNILNQFVSSETSLSLLLSGIKKMNFFSINIEENSIDFCWTNNTTYSLKTNERGFEDKFKGISKIFIESKRIYVYDIKTFVRFLNNYGISFDRKILFDIKIANYIINSNRLDDLKSIANYYSISYDDSVKKVSVIHMLSEKISNEIEENEFNKLFHDLEMPLGFVLTKMEDEGVNLNENLLKEIENKFLSSLKESENKIFEFCGKEFNLASPKQLGEVLFDDLKIISNPKKTKSGQYSTSEEILSKLAKNHPVIADILHWRSLQKLLSTYVIALPKQVNPKTKRIHTIFNQTLTSTGRLSSLNPNLQNIPIRTSNGKLIRKAFTARNQDYVLISADYSQIELRVIASLSNDEDMIKAFNNNEDIHKSTASKVFNIDLENVTKEQRSHAKVVNFGIIYGVSAFGLSNQTNLSRSESKEIIENYYKSYPKLKEFTSNQIEFARSNGYVKTLFGRKRYLNDINSRNVIIRTAAERNAINSPVQGTAADIIKLAMIKIDNELEKLKLKSKLILQVHDELIFDCPKDEIDNIKDMVQEKMQNAYQLNVPLKVDVGEGYNWLEAH